MRMLSECWLKEWLIDERMTSPTGTDRQENDRRSAGGWHDGKKRQRETVGKVEDG